MRFTVQHPEQNDARGSIISYRLEVRKSRFVEKSDGRCSSDERAALQRIVPAPAEPLKAKVRVRIGFLGEVCEPNNEHCVEQLWGM